MDIHNIYKASNIIRDDCNFIGILYNNIEISPTFTIGENIDKYHIATDSRIIDMYSYKCITTYNGKRYNGWQKQGNTANTIQGKIEDTLSRMLDEPIEIIGSGRTDAGVHALGQVFNFHCNTKLSESFIDTSAYGNPFLRDTAHHVPSPLDVEAMKKGASYLIGTHDFKSFCSNKRMKKSSVRTIYDITFRQLPSEELITITFHGNGFLYNMVRIMTGTLIEIGLGKRSPEDIETSLEGLDRSLAGHTAPANGLFLMEVRY